MKIAIKNLLKMIRKISKEELGDVEPLLEEINQHLLTFLEEKHKIITI